MTKEEILKNTVWDEYEMGKCPLFVNMFEQEISFVFFQDFKPNPSISDKMTASVNEILSLDKSELYTIKEMLYEECLFAFQVADYGCEPLAGETSLEAHLREFEIVTKEDAFAKSVVQEIHISQENDSFQGRYSEIKIDSASDNLISIIIKNGKIIDFDDDGTYLGSFEKDEQHAKKNRDNVLNS